MMMEYDSQSQCSDEGVDLSSSELGDVYPTDYAFLEDSLPAFLEAKVVYILMQNSVPVSRASRLQWLLDHLNTVIIPSQKLTDSTNTLDVISAIPREQNVPQCNRFLITYRTEIKFLAHNYRFVYCIDMSPSHANVDIQKGEILFDEILNCFRASLGGLCREFVIPGTSVIFRPCIYLTVIVNTPFFMSPAQQVLVKGVKITDTNLGEIIKYVEKQFHLLENKIADVSAAALDHLEFQCNQNEGLVSDLFDLPETNKIYSQVPIVTPDVNFVNMLRYSMLAISLLPENSLGHILVITDGIVAMPDSNIMESLLYQLHYDSIACSFLKVGSSFHPHAGAGFVSYTDLLYFFAQSTLGTCLENFVHIKNDCLLNINIYHELFLLWSFHSANKYACSRICGNNIWTSLNDTFCSHKVPSFICKRQTDEKINSSILLVLSRRMREGFTVDNIFYLNGNLEIKMILKWQSSIYIHYNLSVEWPSTKNPHYEIYMSAPYEFLHDLTCILKKEPKSLFRQAVIERFWMRLTQIQSDDLGLATKLSSFQMSKDWYMIPESVKNGIPVFILNNTSYSEGTRLVLARSDIYCHKFVNIWQPICQIETTSWKKWFHTHKISLLLRHDTPLPKYLHMASSSQRFQHVQCRQAATALYGFLAEWASFILLDNHTYIKLLHNESEKPPVWFCIVRISSKFPCAVINIGFTTGTPGYFRYQVCEKLKMDLAALSYLSSPLKVKENFCCILVQKPLEKILIRYERIPRNYSTVVFPDGTQPPHTVMNLPSPLSGSLFTTLSRYLFHKRWIWSATLPNNPKLPDHALARILNTLTRMRLKEGFNFAHSASGIITMALELWMEPTACCIFQYVLFPPHQAWLNDEMYSGSEDDNEQSSDSETELQMVTEVWIEPQYGKVVPSNPRIGYIDNKYYYEIADTVNSIDFHCISALLTMEHLSLMCQGKKQDTLVGSLTGLNQSNLNASRKTPSGRCSRNSFMDFVSMPEEAAQWYPITAPRIEHIPFKFDPIGILNLCQQTELLFSMFIETKEKRLLTNCSVDKANSLLLENILEHLGLLHDQELELAKEDSDRFNQEILLRHKNKHPHVCPIAETISHRDHAKESEKKSVSQWRCFIKGVSVTHVILTFVVATLEDLKILVALDNDNIPELNESTEGIDRASSRESNYSDVPINTLNSICLPIYVYDCPLASLVNAFVYNGDNCSLSNEDVYEDHRFKHGSFLHEETLKLKSEEPDYQEYKDDSETEHKSVKQHCKTLVLTHSKCFTISLFVALHHGVYIHSSDVQSSMDQCEESITEIDITEYLMTICAHIKQTKSQDIPISELHQAFPCCELKHFHMMIREKFYKTINTVFSPIHSNSEFYFYKNLRNYEVIESVNIDSDDEVSDNLSDIVEFKSDKDFSIFSEGPHLLQRMESGVRGISDMVKNSDVSPLFLHLICTLKYDSGEVFNTSVRVIPTCLGELIQHFLTTATNLDKSKIQVTLDMLCLTLPPDVQNIINDYSTQGLRSTSFCSDGFQPSIGSTVSDISYNSQVAEPLKHLSENQNKAILSLQEEIKWLLQDEICTALLDVEPVTTDTLNYVMQHVNNSGPLRSSCLLDTINLNFVYASEQSHQKFEEEFSKLTLPYSGYKLCKESDLYYIAKDPNCIIDKDKISYLEISDEENLLTVLPKNDTFYDKGININLLSASRENIVNVNENMTEIDSQQSDVSSLNESATGTDGGYDEDMSEDFDDYDWLITLDKKKQHLPNFWLIMNVAQDVVTVYFHCRFLELPTNHVGEYIAIQRGVCEAVKDLCKRVNQMLLLQSLYESKACDPLLEPDDSSDICNSPISRNTSFARLKSLEVAADSNDDFDMMAYSQSLSEASFNFKPGYFSCPVVWETHFILHPRLKTGPGKSGISRGILALKNILDKFSVSNRNNMFVYRDNQNNVFYLRLHENVQFFNSKASLMRPNEFDTGTVSRSPSFASLPLGQKSALTQSQQSISSATSGDIRPRVRSFGEKESKDTPNGDTLTLRVHGINEAGSDVQLDLVQVLQNRLDDAVLEFLSVMLARNAMCPLTPEDVHFIQKPFRLPEVIIKLTIQEFALWWLESFVHYLKQNLLLFLNIPKYSDNRSHYHFKDYVEAEDTNHPVYEDNIFIYNQSQNPSSGSRGIACIALTLVNEAEKVKKEEPISFTEIFETKEFDNIVASEIINDDGPYNSCYLEFRLWKQGRVNVENLSSKLKSAVSQATWDIILEYYLLKEPPCVENTSLQNLDKLEPITMDTARVDFNREIEFNCDIDMYVDKTARENIGHIEIPRFDYFFLKKKKSRPIFPVPSQKAKRSITFNDMDKDKGLHKEKHQRPKFENKLNSYETGDKGMLSVIYSKYLPSWLDFGHTLNTPSIKKHRVILANRHLSDIIIAELLSMLPDTPKAFHSISTSRIKSKSEDIFVPFVTANNKIINKYIIISRNLEQWSTTINMTDCENVEFPDAINPNTLKHSQKFVPTICKVFIPRQKILWIAVENDCITIYTYNWVKDNIDKLITSCTNLGLWLSVRSCFLNSVTSQKLGLFHNQPLTRKIFMIPNNPYANFLGNCEHMINFPKDHSHKKGQPTFNLPSTLEVFRDNFKICKFTSIEQPIDPTFSLTQEMRAIKSKEKTNREEMKILHGMYQSRTSTVTVPQLKLLIQNARIVHYCHTPLLFLPRWRLKTATTRDHSLYPSQAIQLADKLVVEDKEMWHKELCYAFFLEYRHYMQTLGFMPLQIDNPRNNSGMWTTDKSCCDNVFYIQKTILGGILIFTAEFKEPFFTTKLLAIECNRLQNISSRASINRFTLSFLDECDRVKILMHLHSFTYDYHLRCIYNYISGTPTSNKICERYNINQFLDDFLKYYNKAPNFARNLVHTDTLTIKDLVTQGQQLYQYLLSNVSQYDFKVLEMEVWEGELEYILFQVTSTSQVSYKDSQDQQCTDDFDITLVVHNMCTPYSPSDKVLHLRYYLILTSKREIYPKSEVEEKLGKFRTVSSTARSLSTQEKEADTEDMIEKSEKVDNEYLLSIDPYSKDSNVPLIRNQSSDSVNNGTSSHISQQSNSVPYVEIYQESVNYLGYYSSHEQLMQQLILDKASATQEHIKNMVEKGMVHCRTHLLWNRLISPQDSNNLTYDEFLELKSLAKLEHLCHMHPNLGPLLNQPLGWYQGLAKLLLIKYADHNRSFISSDGNIQHHVILDQRYFGAFMLLSMDLHTARGDLYAVYREPQRQEDTDLCLAYQKSLLDGFVNCICFYLWSGMISY